MDYSNIDFKSAIKRRGRRDSKKSQGVVTETKPFRTKTYRPGGQWRSTENYVGGVRSPSHRKGLLG